MHLPPPLLPSSATSDEIPFNVPAYSDVAVSMYVPVTTGGSSTHGYSLQDNFLADGDVSANVTLSNATTIDVYYFLTNLDVINSATQGAVVTLGASITDGLHTIVGDNRRWPNDLALRLRDAGHTIGVLDQGISGDHLLGSGNSASQRFNRDVLGQSGVRWVIFADCPINDLHASKRPTAAQLITGLKTLIAEAHQAGVNFLCATLTPVNGTKGWTAAAEKSRKAYNTFVKSNTSGCDGVVDMARATRSPHNPLAFLTSYDSGDHLHPNELGLQAIANAVNLTYFNVNMITATAKKTKAHHRHKPHVRHLGTWATAWRHVSLSGESMLTATRSLHLSPVLFFCHRRPLVAP